MECSLSEVEPGKREVLDVQLKSAISSTDRAFELIERVKCILDRIDGKRTPSCEGICPMCGKVWDQ